MHSYKNLAVIALAASAISPALAAPLQESQNQARAELGARGGLGIWGLALSLLPVLFGGSGKSRRSGSDVAPDELFKALSGLSKRTDPGTGPSTEDLVAALKLFGRALNELD